MSPNSPASLAVALEPTDHMLGSEHARVTIVEYGDFECPSCKVAATTPMLLLERFPNRIRFVFRHFPLQEAHPHALMAAEAGESGNNGDMGGSDFGVNDPGSGWDDGGGSDGGGGGDWS